ncbi:Flp pilus assembly protein CpaB [Mangrovibacillus cuniculi]|uniref:Flp pilus assembly protein CpaB n=1 Tax=Mangrovibacillus cuniculi TaxID=2593652 RepID=UPI001EFA22F5|nr:flp pilus assembly protein CpaB [Mangrovibacillus cuniculi]
MLESKRRAAIFLVLAFVLAATAGYLVLEKVKSLNAELGGMTAVYVANGEIPARTQIQESQIKTVEIPNKFVTSSHVTNKEDILDQVVVVPLKEEELITSNIIKPYSNLRKEENRLVAMYPSEKIMFDQVIEPLDRVDIITSVEANGQDGKYKTEVFMRDVPVAYAQGAEDDFRGVALEVSMEDAAKLIHAQNYADKIRVLKANAGATDSVLPEQSKPEEKVEKPAAKEEQPAKTETPKETTEKPATEQTKPTEKK